MLSLQEAFSKLIDANYFLASGLGASLAGGVAGAALPASAAAPALGASAFGAGLLQPKVQSSPTLKIMANAKSFFMDLPFQLNIRVIGRVRQEPLPPAIQLDSDHWAIIPHKSTMRNEFNGRRRFFSAPTGE
jgi:hypothetical protein